MEEIKKPLGVGEVVKLLTMAAIMLAGLYACFSPSESKHEAAFKPEAGKKYQTKSGYYIAPTVEILDKALQLRADKEAITKMVLSGDLAISKTGVQVYCDAFTSPGVIKIRIPGETEGVYTFVEMLEPIPSK